METLIVGAGAVGRWIGRTLDGAVAFADADPDAAEDAAAALDDATTVPLESETAFDAVAVAVPMRVASETIDAQAQRARDAVVDFTGSMAAPLSTMADAAPDLERASYHPLFAPEHAPGRIAVSSSASGSYTGAIEAALEAAGNDLVRVQPEAHDRAMQTIQGRAHAAILAFGLAAEEVPEDLATPVYEELDALRDRVTGGSPGVYADIQDVFDGSADVAEAARELVEADRETFATLYDDAG